MDSDGLRFVRLRGRLILAALVVMILGWHLVCARLLLADAPLVADWSLFRNVVVLDLSAEDLSPAFRESTAYEMGTELDERLFEDLGAKVYEKRLNQAARDFFDLYALALPWTVRLARPVTGRGGER